MIDGLVVAALAILCGAVVSCGAENGNRADGSSSPGTVVTTTDEEEQRLQRVLESHNIDVTFERGRSTVGRTDRASAVRTVLEEFGPEEAKDVTTYIARVTTRTYGEELATDPTAPSTVDPALDDERVWLVQLHDLETRANGSITDPAPTDTYIVDLIVFVDGNGEFQFASEIPRVLVDRNSPGGRQERLARPEPAARWAQMLMSSRPGGSSPVERRQ